MKNTEDMKALHLHLGGPQGLKEANGVFSRLFSICGDKVLHRKLTDSELTSRGYDPSFVTQVITVLLSP